MTEIYTQSVALHKAELPITARMRGRVLDEAIVANGVMLHEPRTLVFMGFTGAWQRGGTYSGQYRFRRVWPQDEALESFLLSDLPSAGETVDSTEESDDGSNT